MSRVSSGAKPDTFPLRSPIGRLAFFLALGVLAWAAIWTTTSQPRADYDTLWYARFTFQFAGASRTEAIDRSWETFAEYGDPERVRYVAERDGWPWSGEFDPSRQRWVGIYAMRPVMPLVSSLGVGWLGIHAPLVASLLAVTVLTMAAGLVLAPVAGITVVAVFLGLTYLNPGSAGWLVHLTTDGLGMALWFAALAIGARLVQDGRAAWLAAFGGVALVLAFTRQTVIILPLAFGLSAAAALVLGSPAWRRFAAVTLAALPAIVVFTAYTTFAGLPSISDILQDAPTTHFSRPDVADPIGYLIRTNLAHLPTYLATLLTTPHLAASVLLGLLGYAVNRGWWTLPFLCSLAAIPLLQAVHPILTEAPRALAPAWLSIHLGLGLLVARLARSAVLRTRVRKGRVPPGSSTLAIRQ